METLEEVRVRYNSARKHTHTHIHASQRTRRCTHCVEVCINLSVDPITTNPAERSNIDSGVHPTQHGVGEVLIITHSVGQPANSVVIIRTEKSDRPSPVAACPKGMRMRRFSRVTLRSMTPSIILCVIHNGLRPYQRLSRAPLCHDLADKAAPVQRTDHTTVVPFCLLLGPGLTHCL